MMQVSVTIPEATTGSRLRRLPFVVLLTVGLLLSLIHCAGCDLSFSSTNTTAVAMNPDRGPAPDTPEQQLPCHSGHCLSHVTARLVVAEVIPGDYIPQAPSFGQEQFPATLAGLPLFKPPRA
jgi:hypothetical protein